MTQYQWTVIGAGPAGIASVGMLIDHGITPDSIAWIDPQFTAGDLGAKWRAVPSNTRVALFLDYLTTSPAFGFSEAPHFELLEIDPQQTCVLGALAKPLMWVSQHLGARVSAYRTTATELSLHERRWTIHTENGAITSKNVILAVGSVPKRLPYDGVEEIAVETALDPEKLAQQSLDGATIAVFGSSHSAMIALPNLLASPASRVVNFYRGPLTYAVEFEHWTLFDDIGLKGQAANWARENIDGVTPARLERYSVRGDEFHELLHTCDHVVYTIGFERRQLPATPQWGPLSYNDNNGILAPGLFGIGIAFPEFKTDPFGFGEHRVGLHKFILRLKDVLPLWLRYGSQPDAAGPSPTSRYVSAALGSASVVSRVGTARRWRRTTPDRPSHRMQRAHRAPGTTGAGCLVAREGHRIGDGIAVREPDRDSRPAPRLRIHRLTSECESQ